MIQSLWGCSDGYMKSNSRSRVFAATLLVLQRCSPKDPEMDHHPLPQSSGEVDQLAEQLRSDDNFVRAEAARQLCNMGVVARRTLPRLLALAGDPWYQVRIQVPRAIIHLRATAGEAAVVLAQLLKDPDETVRLYAQEAQRVVSGR